MLIKESDEVSSLLISTIEYTLFYYRPNSDTQTNRNNVRNALITKN